MLKKTINITTVISLCLLIVLLNITTPSWSGPLGILAVFVFAYLLSLGLVTYLIYWCSRLISYFSRHLISKKPLLALDFKRSYYFSTILATAPIIFIGLQSVGGVGFYELSLVLIFIFIGCLYVSKRMR